MNTSRYKMRRLKHNFIVKIIQLELKDTYRQLFHTRNELCKHHRLISCSLPGYLSLSFFNRQEFIFNKSWAKELNRINKKLYIRCTTLFPPFFSEIRGFIVKNWLYIYDSKYCPSLATTFSHLSGSVRIPRRKNLSSFEAVHESIQFFTSS